MPRIRLVATLRALFDAPFGKDLAFKGGTSLSKAFRAIAHSVARHKSMSSPRQEATGNRIDYQVAVHGGLQPIPSGSALDAPAADYGRMLADGMLVDTDEPFGRPLKHCAGNEAGASSQDEDD